MLKCRVLCGNPLQRFGSGLEPDQEPNREFGPVANTTRYYQKMKSMLMNPPRLKFKKKPMILEMKTQTKTKIIQPYQRARINEAEMTSYRRSPKMTKRRCLNRTGCYLNSYSNNKPNGKRTEPQCAPNSNAAEQLIDRSILEITP